MSPPVKKLQRNKMASCLALCKPGVSILRLVPAEPNVYQSLGGRPKGDNIPELVLSTSRPRIILMKADGKESIPSMYIKSRLPK